MDIMGNKVILRGIEEKTIGQQGIQAGGAYG